VCVGLLSVRPFFSRGTVDRVDMVNFIFSGFVIQLGPIQICSPRKSDAEGEGLKV
jgi:hypothetical protein